MSLAACSVEAPPQDAPTTLRDVTIPADFTFQTSQTVAVTIAPADEAFGVHPDAPVEVRRPDGAVLYRGAVKKGTPLEVEVSVPTAVETLDVSVGKQRSTMTLERGVAGND